MATARLAAGMAARVSVIRVLASGMLTSTSTSTTTAMTGARRVPAAAPASSATRTTPIPPSTQVTAAAGR